LLSDKLLEGMRALLRLVSLFVLLIVVLVVGETPKATAAP
jgi:sugar phosphate permease